MQVDTIHIDPADTKAKAQALADLPARVKTDKTTTLNQSTDF